MRSGFPADHTSQEIADQRLALFLGKTRNRGSIRSHDTHPYLATGSTIRVQTQLSTLKGQGFRKQVTAGRPRCLSDEAMAEKSDPTDTTHAGMPA